MSEHKWAALKKAVEDAAELSGVHQPVDANFPIKEIDSLGRAEIILCVEGDFSIVLTNDEILKIETYGDLVNIIKSRQC